MSKALTAQSRSAFAVLFAAGLLTLLVGALPRAEAAPDAAPAPPAAPAAKPVRPMIPKPFNPGREEQEHLKRYDAAIAPVTAIGLSDDDRTRVRDAIKAIASGNPSKGDDLASGLSDETAKKLVLWYRLRGGFGSATEIRAFLDQNPMWPDRALLNQRLEEALFTAGGSSADIRAAFKGDTPDTAAGWAALASAALAEGHEKEAAQLAAKSWRDANIAATLETGFLARFGKLLGPADHKYRLDRLLIDEIRWAGQRNERAQFVRRLIPLLSPPEQAKAQARLKAFLQQDGGRAAIEALPAQAAPDWGLVYHKVQVLRRANRIADAAKLMLTVPLASDAIVNPDEWWIERRANAYAALRIGNPKLAYELVRDSARLSVNPVKDQTFIAGWIAFRFLKNSAAARGHFEAMLKAADGPLSRAKANYWLGRVAKADGDAAGAATYFKAATADPDTFHGFLSMQELVAGRQDFPIAAPAAPSDEDLARFRGADAVRAAVIANKAGLDRSIIQAFLVQLRLSLKTEVGAALVAHLSEAVGDTQMAVRTAKAAIGSRQNLLYYAYPVHPFPAYTPLRKPPETAFLLGIARQETEFNTLTVSGAGAKGLLQVMTVTAQHVCRDYRIKCELKRLLSDPPYNTMMAAAYIADRMDGFGGSYVLGLAGYNAGPGRAREWIREFGDPRDPKIDPIDWIERIPFQETREYVAKVLANVQVYRARLGEERPMRIGEDLARARGSKAAPAPDRDDAAVASPAADGSDG